MSYSVAIPAYNAERTIADTLASVLAQTLPAQEIVVVDDGSSDRTGEVAAAVSPLVRVVRQANQGPGTASTTGIKEARCPIVAFVDADDLWLPEKMAKQIAYLEAHPQISLIGTHMRQFPHGQADDGTGEVRKGLIRSTLVLRKTVFDTIGEIKDFPGRMGDLIDWIARAREAGFGDHELEEVLALRRILPGSLSHGLRTNMEIGYLKAAHMAMQRRKAARNET